MLKFFFGCMGSGKSLQLLATAYNFEEHKIPFMVLKSEIDNRDGVGVIHSRALGDRNCITILKNDSIIDVVKNNKTFFTDTRTKYILIDEVQFLTVEQIEELAYLVDKFSINVYCYGLKTDFKTKLFPASQRLFEIADEFIQIESFCHCGNKTCVNARVNHYGEVITNGKQVEIGGDDRYIAMCRKEFFQKINKKLYDNTFQY